LWCAAGGLAAIGLALFYRQTAMLAAANPAARLPWLGRPPRTPSSSRRLGALATFLSSLAMDCAFHALGQRHLYYLLWIGLPLMLLALAVIMVPQARHNRRVGSAA